jgi:hypothetical protein
MVEQVGAGRLIWRADGASEEWSEIVYKYDLHYNETMEFKIQANFLKMSIHKSNGTTARKYTWSDHGESITACLSLYGCM